MKKIFYLKLVLLLFLPVISFSQSDDSGVKNNTSQTPPEGVNSSPRVNAEPLYPLEWDEQLKQAMESGNTFEEARVRELIRSKTIDYITVPDLNDRDGPAPVNQQPPFTPDWMPNDVLVYTGDIGQVGSGHRRIDMVMAEDGNLYLAYIVRPETGANGLIRVHRSTDGGLTWTYINGISSATAFFGQVSLTVNMRGITADSTRVHVFYSRSTDGTAFNDATINWASFRGDGSAWIGGVSAITPAAGNRLWFPSAYSDGWYWGSATWIGVVCGEYNNSTGVCVSLRKARTDDWGTNYTVTTLTDGYPSWGDFVPSAAFKKNTTTATDSVYIAVERRFPASPSITRILATPWANTATLHRYSVPTSSTVNYRNPSITIVQSALTYNSNRIILVSSVKDNAAVYHQSTNSGSSWDVDFLLGVGTEIVPEYTHVSSDTSQAGPGNLMACYQMGGGDTIVVRRGIAGSLGTRLYKPNQFLSSPFNSPVTAIYRTTGGSRYSAFAYTGLSGGNYTSNVYYDQENLPTNIQHSGNNIADEYSLHQNFPNPFNPETNIRFSIPANGTVTIVVYDIIGKEVATLVNTKLEAGNYTVNFNASGLTSGVYFYKMTTENYSDVKKMLLLK